MAQTYVGNAVKTPTDVTPITVDWSDWLAVTEDAIYDCDVEAPGLDVHDCWFTKTDTTARVGGGVDNGVYTITFIVQLESGEWYSRSVKLRCRNG